MKKLSVKKLIKKRIVLIITLMITVQVMILCCVSVVHATESHGLIGAGSSGRQSYSVQKNGSYAEWLSDKIDTLTRCRSRWLYELMTAAGYEVTADKSNGLAVLEQARGYGIVNVYSQDDIYLPLSRRFVGYTMVKAFGYPSVSAGYIADISEEESYMSAMAYFGYFIPDINNEIHPDRVVTGVEFDKLLMELGRYRLLKGKSVLSFGDSIMYGTGNDGEGISDMIAMKYGMTCTDYSVPGATLGESSGRGHIPDQIRKAYSERKTADVIMINGGTNDMNHTSLGSFTDGFDMSKTSEKSYTGAFERSLWLLRTYWRGVPVIYIRAHNMAFGEDSAERRYGERALEITEKWGVRAVDLFNGSDMNTEDPFVCSRYTYLNPYTDYTCDSIHPNAIGYAKFYLPPVTEALESLMRKEALS